MKAGKARGGAGRATSISSYSSMSEAIDLSSEPPTADTWTGKKAEMVRIEWDSTFEWALNRAGGIVSYV